MNDGPMPIDTGALIRAASEEFFKSAGNLLKIIHAPHRVSQDLLRPFELVQLTCSQCGPIKSFSFAEASLYHPDGESDVEHFQDDHECFYNRQAMNGNHPAPNPLYTPKRYFVPPSMAETQRGLRWQLSRVLTEVNEEWYPYSEPIWPWKECHACL